MSKTRTVLFGVLMSVSLAGFSSAGSGAASRTIGSGPAGAPAMDSLVSLAPSDQLTAMASPEWKAAPFVLESAKVIEPGRDLAPKVEDPARIKAILKLVSDVYDHVHLPYSQDGATFTNKEGKLPQQPLGFYKEYTLLTGAAPHTVVIDGTTYQVAPDLSARGSERIILGGGEKLYYTPDHYAHFIQLTVVR